MDGSEYGDGVHLTHEGPTARLEERDGRLVRLLHERFDPPVLLDAETARSAPQVLAVSGVAGGATYDGLIALAARMAGVPLASRDRRAMGTYRALGIDVEVVG